MLNRPSAPARIAAAFLVAGMILGNLAAGEFESWLNPKAKLKISSRLAQAPGGMTLTPDGSTILSLHQFQNSDVRVAEITPEGTIHAFPNKSMSTTDGKSPVKLDSVLGIQSDKKGVVWMLDNARRGETTPKLVAWDTRDDKLAKVIYLPTPVTIATSFVNDLALDPEEPYIYITDPAAGDDAALIVVNTETGFARRVLQGHHSVIPLGQSDRGRSQRQVGLLRADGWQRPLPCASHRSPGRDLETERARAARRGMGRETDL